MIRNNRAFVCLTLAMGVLLSSIAVAEQRALLVGVGKYKMPGHDLPGIDLDRLGPGDRGGGTGDVSHGLAAIHAQQHLPIDSIAIADGRELALEVGLVIGEGGARLGLPDVLEV